MPLLQGLTAMVVFKSGQELPPWQAEVVVVVTPLQGLVVLTVVELRVEPGWELSLSAETLTEALASICST